MTWPNVLGRSNFCAIPRWYIVPLGSRHFPSYLLSLRAITVRDPRPHKSPTSPPISAQNLLSRTPPHSRHANTASRTSTTLSASNAMPGLVSDSTRIWELNIHWPVNAQCGVWDPKLKGVDVWECIRARESQILYYALRY